MRVRLLKWMVDGRRISIMGKLLRCGRNFFVLGKLGSQGGNFYIDTFK